MSLRRNHIIVATTAALLLALLAVLGPTPAAAAPGMAYGVEQNGGMEEANQRNENLDRMGGLGAQVIRYVLRYDRIAGCDPRASGVAASSATNPCYDFSAADAVVQGAASRNMQVVMSIYGTPPWMFNGKFNFTGNSHQEFLGFAGMYGEFAAAAAARYSGSMGLPRVPYWTIWNEPNGSYFWSPRTVGGKLVAPERYAELYTVGATRIKQVDPNFIVAAGPTAPTPTGLKPGVFLEHALPVLEQLNAPIDAWAHNGYNRNTSPLKAGMRYPEIGLGNIKDLTGMLDQYNVTAGKSVWITEFAYETDTLGISAAKQSNYLADATYVAWRNPRVGMFIWYALFDDTPQTNSGGGMQSGLYHDLQLCPQKWCAKPSAFMFQHPLWISSRKVRRGKTITLWGHGRLSPAQTKIYIWRGKQWEYFNNQSSYPDGSVYVTYKVKNDTWFVACDTACGDIQKVSVIRKG